MVKQTKIEAVRILTELFSKASSFILVDYQGLSHQQLEQVRQQVRQAQGALMVVKNSLLVRALKAKSQAEKSQALRDFLKPGFNKAELAEAPSAEAFQGPTAVLFAFNDPLAPLKALSAFVKELGLIKYKLGFLDQQILTSNQVLGLSLLPGRSQLQAQIVNVLVNPLTGFLGVLEGNMRNLVYILNQRKEQF